MRRRPLQVLTGPPGTVFYAVLATALLWLWWSLGTPGFAFFPIMPLAWVILGAGLAWAVKLIAMVVRRRRGEAPPRAWSRFAAAPALVVLFMAAAWNGGALQARWALSRAAFEEKVQQAQQLDEEAEVDDLAGRIGVYRIHVVHRVGDGVLFYEAHGSLFDDAGFAYLPKGPTADLENGGFENPQFEHLEDDWYVWTASW